MKRDRQILSLLLLCSYYTIPPEPPKPSDISIPLTCEDNSSDWMISWMYEEWEQGVVYPNMKFMLEIESNTTVLTLTSGNPGCSNVTAAGTTCNVTLTKDSYSISVTLTNDLGSTMDSITIESKCYFMNLLL
jgi:hypothetical protein